MGRREDVLVVRIWGEGLREGRLEMVLGSGTGDEGDIQAAAQLIAIERIEWRIGKVIAVGGVLDGEQILVIREKGRAGRAELDKTRFNASHR